MAKRTSKVTVNVEYVPEHKIRTSKIVVNVEYVPERKIRTSKLVVMVEYVPVEFVPRVFGPAAQSM